MQSSSITDYNKDYTALLLNCYVKKDKKNEIKEFLTIHNDQEPIFDVDTAIEVCRQQDLTREYAIDLAEKKKRWKLLVQIYIENQKLYKKALIKIDQNIDNVREKVDMLQMYGPKLLKQCEKQDRENNKNYPTYNFMEARTKEDERTLTTKDVMDVAFRIVQALVYYVANGKFRQDSNLNLGKNQVVRIEDLLQIFVDQHDLMTDFLKKILDEYKDERNKEKY